MSIKENYNTISESSGTQPLTIATLEALLQSRIKVKEITPNQYAILFLMQKVNGGLYEVFLVEGDNSLFLSDNGTTVAELDKIFELDEPDVIKNLVAICRQYECKKVDKSIVIDCTTENIHTKLSHLIQAMSFMLNMRIFYI